jgi:hypothetical protein
MKNVILVLVMIAANSAFAAAAASYTCVGKNKAKQNESVSFDLLFADSAPGAGYTNQSITITKEGSFPLQKAVVLQMYDATAKNECKVTSQGEINLSGKHFSMEPTKEGSLADYEVTFKISCANGPQYDVVAGCVFDY